MKTTQSLQSIVDSFIAAIRGELRDEISAEVRNEIAVQLAIGGKATVSKRSNGSPARAVTRKGGKRSPEEIAALTGKLQAYVKKTPGQRIEQVAKAMGVSTAELVTPVTKLLTEKKLRKSGTRRATKYFPK
jgi:hypothetical protein